jgi:hypothetical protein
MSIRVTFKLPNTGIARASGSVAVGQRHGQRVGRRLRHRGVYECVCVQEQVKAAGLVDTMGILSIARFRSIWQYNAAFESFRRFCFEDAGEVGVVASSQSVESHCEALRGCEIVVAHPLQPSDQFRDAWTYIWVDGIKALGGECEEQKPQCSHNVVREAPPWASAIYALVGLGR